MGNGEREAKERISWRKRIEEEELSEVVVVTKCSLAF